MQSTIVSTPLGPMTIEATHQGICSLAFSDHTNNVSPHVSVHNDYITQGICELGEYFEGKRREFNVPLDMSGTVFQQAAWQALLHIPYGTTISYSDQATRMGNPRAVRAVGLANGANKIAIIIPCHRVVGKDGRLTGYSAGLERKRWLLEHERGSVGKELFR